MYMRTKLNTRFIIHGAKTFRNTINILSKSTNRLLTTVSKTKQSLQHDSFESFINYTSIQKSDLESTVYRGTLYEYTVLDTLHKLNYNVHRTGGADDKGVDLRGTWTLGTNEPIQVVVQCKNESKKVGPKYVRELCGISTGQDTLLVLASSSTYTPKALQSFMASDRPICLFVINAFADGGNMRQMIWNNAAQSSLEGLEVRSIHDKLETRLKVLYKSKTLRKLKKTSP